MKKYKISFILNLLIFILTISGVFMMLANIKFMPGKDLLSSSSVVIFKYFTVDSNILIGLISLLMCYYEYKLIKNKINFLPNYIYILKLIGTISVTITFLVTLFYLAPNIENGYYVLYKNSNLFFHLITPLLSIISFLFFERTNKIKIKHISLCLIPLILYGIFYITNILIHLENGKVLSQYDFYGFVKGGTNTILITFLVMLIGCYILSLFVWFLNKKRDN